MTWEIEHLKCSLKENSGVTRHPWEFWAFKFRTTSLLCLKWHPLGALSSFRWWLCSEKKCSVWVPQVMMMSWTFGKDTLRRTRKIQKTMMDRHHGHWVCLHKDCCMGNRAFWRRVFSVEVSIVWLSWVSGVTRGFFLTPKNRRGCCAVGFREKTLPDLWKQEFFLQLGSSGDPAGHPHLKGCPCCSEHSSPASE